MVAYFGWTCQAGRSPPHSGQKGGKLFCSTTPVQKALPAPDHFWPQVGHLTKAEWSGKSEGYRGEYRAPYRPDYVMTNHYLERDGWCYWFIYPKMLNRERAKHRKHRPISCPVAPPL